jgi:hypothetical protein
MHRAAAIIPTHWLAARYAYDTVPAIGMAVDVLTHGGAPLRKFRTVTISNFGAPALDGRPASVVFAYGVGDTIVGCGSLDFNARQVATKIARKRSSDTAGRRGWTIGRRHRCSTRRRVDVLRWRVAAA